MKTISRSQDQDQFSLQGNSSYYRLDVDGEIVFIPVNDKVFAHFQEQFLRGHPTELFRKRYTTLNNLMRAAYKEAYEEGIKEGLKRASGG